VLAQTNAILGAADPEYVADEADVPLALLGAGAALAELMNEIGRERRANPTDDVTSALVTAEIDGEGLSPDELASFFVLLAVAGNETTRNAISWGMQALCDHPDQRRAWVEHFDQLAATAVEEIVRWASPVIFMRRTATRSALLSGHRFDEGDRILLIYSSANRDERVFRDPFRFDLAREENRHVGFGGFGPHYCLGAHLARQEITTMFRELLRRLPDLEVSGPPVRLRSSFINGVKHLPVTYSPSRLTG
jgi:methyl-branched lipid omega-hydroxylase